MDGGKVEVLAEEVRDQKLASQHDGMDPGLARPCLSEQAWDVHNDLVDEP